MPQAYLGRLLYIDGYFLDANDGDAEHAWQIARGLARLGWQVMLVGPMTRAREHDETLCLEPVYPRAGLLPVAITRKVMDVVHRNRFDVAFVRPALKLGFTTAYLRTCLPYVVELHSNTVEEYRSLHISPLKTMVARWAEQFEFAGAVGAFCITRELTRYAAQILPPRAPTWITGNGFPSDEISLLEFDYAARRASGVPLDATVLVFLGSLQPWQGVDLVIQALKDLPDTWLWIIGEGTERARLERLANELGVAERVRWCGWQVGSGLRDLMRVADIGIGTLALGRKGMYEAQATKVRTYLGSGLPIIIGYCDTLLDEHSPGVFYAQDVSQLTARIREIRANVDVRDPEYRARIRSFAVEQLSWAAIAERTSDILREIVAEKKRQVAQ